MLYVRGCIVQADTNDKHKDLLTKEDIKKININFGDIRFDEHHTRHEVSGCRLIENTVTDYPITIDHIRLKPGSWIATVEVDNPDLEDDIHNHRVNGFSLFSYAGGAESYREVLDKSDVYPLFLSFVEDPANMIPFEVLTADEYISKSSKDENIMADEKSILDKIKELVNSAEEEPAIEKEAEAEETTVEEEVAESAPEEAPEAEKDDDGAVEKEAGEAVETQEEEVIVEEDDSAPEETEDAPVDEEAIEKDAGVNLEEIRDLLIQVITILTPTEEETSTEEPAEDAPVDEPVAEEKEEEDVVEEKYIVKNATHKHETLEEPAPKASPKFDLFGRKLR